MCAQLALLLLSAAYIAAEAASGDMSLNDMSLRRSMLASECPIQYCKTGRNCVYSSRTKKWTCTSCTGIRIPNGAKSECVCPVGYFPTSDGGCSLCKDNMYCPQGQSALKSTAKACPTNMVTLKRGAKSINDCFNTPGYYYRKNSDGIKAIPCGVNQWTTGLKKQTTCTACLTGFKTDPETVPGSHTSSDVCQAPAGSFVTGSTVTLCPKGEYSDDYSLSTSCKTCEDLYSPGITTQKEGSTSADNCTWLEPGYVLQDDKKKAILGTFDPINTPITGAKKCPQNYYCPGGDPTGNGKPVRCPHGMWTEDEGAASEDECVAPPGMYLPDGLLTDADKMIKHCPQGTYKETWQRIGVAGCLPCGTGDDYWLSDKTIFLNDLDPNTGLIRQQIGVRGSSDSCYIQRGMGAVQERNQTSSAVVLRAIICPANYYGVVGVNVTSDGVWKKYGKVATPCTQCPTNMITDGASGKVTSIKIAGVDGQSLDDKTVAATEGYYTVDSCFTQPGYGYYQGASQLCAEGYYNPGLNKLPCTQCPFGLTTNFSQPINDAAADCTKYIAGYGLLNDIPQLCAIGQYQPPQQDKGTTCTACPASLTTGAVGGDSADSCNFCAAGYGNIAQNTTCQSCQDGYFGTADRKDNKCTKCPGGRTFSYDYQGVDDIFAPQTTSKPYSTSQANCVADFSQTVEGAFYLDLQAGVGFAKVAAKENLQSCVQNCRDDATCIAATFDYATLDCWNWNPDTQESFVANGGVAFKLVSSTTLAASVHAQEMGSGEYNFIPDGVNTPARLNPTSLSAAVATTSLKACLKACSEVNLCSGVVFGQFSGEDTIAASSCKLIMGKSLPGSSLRTLIKANFMGLNTNMKVSAGYYSQPSTTTVTICPGSDEAQTGYYCPGGAAPGAAPRQKCAAANPAGTYMPAGTEKADDCGAWLKANWYWNGASVVACDADSYCPGGENFFGSATAVGIYPCPAGTKSAASSSSMADCNKLYAGFYYKAPGAISSTTIKSCDEGYYCKTNDVAIVVGTTTTGDRTDGNGRNPCPMGTSSFAGTYPTAGPAVAADCTRLLAGYEYAGTAISEANINTCNTDTYCEGERAISGATAIPGTACPEGTGVDKKVSDDDAGAKSANDCTKLYEGYYYTGVGTAISRTTVLPCPVNSFCQGYPTNAKTITRGSPTLPTACPAGTKVDAGTAFADDATFRTANLAALPTTSAATGARYTNDCDKLKAGYYYDGPGSITSSTVKLCTADYYCNTEDLAIVVGTDTAAGASGINPCPSGVNSLVGSKTVDDCNILEAGWYYDGPGTISGTTVLACATKYYCTGGATVDVVNDDIVGRTPCAAGSTSAASSSSSADCSDLLPGWYYTAAGAISDDTVLACPEDYYCDGIATITVAVTGVAQGRTACPVGSGSAVSSSSIDQCTKIYPGYYYQGNAACTHILPGATANCMYRVCDAPGTNAYCPGGTLSAVNTAANEVRTICASGTRTVCDVITPGVDCVKDADCISP